MINWKDNTDGSKAPVTPGLRPGYDIPATEKWVNRRKNIRLVAKVVQQVAEVVGDRKGKISRSNVVIMLKKPSHPGLTTMLRPTSFPLAFPVIWGRRYGY